MIKTDSYALLSKYTQGLAVALGYRDLMTRLHSERVHSLCEEIGERIGLDEEDFNALRIGSWFHDIGKIGIPDAILLKPDMFDASEWEVMKRHSEIGEDIMISTGLEGSEAAARIIRHHHEHYDGGGYPDGLKGEEIPFCSRIVSIVDSYDALAVTRSYHRARSQEEVLEMMLRESGIRYDPAILEVFLEMVKG
ncbi:MAG: HD-GYP domain-containing protein [Burkholderiales bacterium]|nr:HD-GYP domain-containing protein [Burkholderiales bacterium]